MKLKHDGELSLASVVDPLLGYCYPDEARRARYCSGSSRHFLNQLILRRAACSEDVDRGETGPNNLTVAAQRPRCVCCRAAAEGEHQNNQFVLHHFNLDKGTVHCIPSQETFSWASSRSTSSNAISPASTRLRRDFTSLLYSTVTKASAP